MKAIKLVLIIILTLTCGIKTFSNVRLPKLIGNNMLLQRGIPLKIWGWADIGEKVTITFQSKTYEAMTDGSGKWLANLPALSEGGPYTMDIAGKNKITIENILVGDVWLCGGQSNMEMKFEELGGKYDKELAASTNSKIRLITIEQNKSYTPVEEVNATGWEEASPKALRRFSAVGYFFGREIFDKYKVPIGLISDNWGGTYAEAWTSEEGLKNFPEILKTKTFFLDNRETFDKRFAEWDKKVKDQIKASYSDTLKTNWSEDIAKLPTMTIPGHWESSVLPDFDGVVWLMKDIEIPKANAGKEITLDLGYIDDNDITYFNGKKLGETIGYSLARTYKVPGNLVKAGKNRISIRATDHLLNGGMTGNPADIKASGNGIDIPLAGGWKFKKSVVFDIPKQPEGGNTPNVPTVLYNGMLHPIKAYGIKGAIWYQGESNADNAYEYRSIFPNMIKDWRNQWGLGSFPFVYVQLANFMQSYDYPTTSAWAELREAQTMALSLPNTAMAVAIDIGETGDIHPKNKLDVGKRLALGAIKVAYNDNVVYSGPLYEGMTVEGNKVRLKFTNTGSGLQIKNGSELKEFAIAGADQKFVSATAKIEGNTVLVSSEKIQNPVAVRYAWADNPINVNLYNKEGLPASPFRTDSWKGKTQKK
ncbi:MAG TPA: sialate O-acetylesterase [Cytophagaceae bacterium]|jgi:sialate O-acetylesterase